MVEFFSRLLSVRGRANRALYWKTVILVYLCIVAAALLMLGILSIKGKPSGDASPDGVADFVVAVLFCAIFCLIGVASNRGYSATPSRSRQGMVVDTSIVDHTSCVQGHRTG